MATVRIPYPLAPKQQQQQDDQQVVERPSAPTHCMHDPDDHDTYSTMTAKSNQTHLAQQDRGSLLPFQT
ncbi:hypothetical protein [Absidia glauca]|uniref:Uncharacterized protein n=1 Tax=Absidia glauca TaxID=4829 RepID=A0A168P9Q4_ABSGL|nr:hypothetical protein [Absidia glauca]